MTPTRTLAVAAAVAALLMTTAPAASAQDVEHFGIDFEQLFVQPGQTIPLELSASASGMELVASIGFLERYATVTPPAGTTYDPETQSIRWTSTASNQTVTAQVAFDSDAPIGTLLSTTITSVADGPNCLGACYDAIGIVQNAGDPDMTAALPKTGTEPWHIVAGAALAVLLGLAGLAGGRQSRRAR